MVRFEDSIVISRPVAEVFAFTVDPEKEPLWQPSVRESRQISEGPMGKGATVRNVTRLLGRNMESFWEVTEYEVNRKRGARSSSRSFPYAFVDIYEPVDGGTKLTSYVQLEAVGIFKLVEPLVGFVVRRQLASILSNLKTLLEEPGTET